MSAARVAVFVDGDQTLWDFDAVMRRSVAATIDELARRVGHPDGDTGVDAFVADRQQVARLAGPGTSLEELRVQAFASSLRRLGIPDVGGTLAQELTEFYLARRWSEVDLYEDALPTLRALRALPGCRVGLLSNGNTDPTRLGLDDCFDAVLLGDDIGARKPDVEAFRVAQARLPAPHHVIVGDSLRNDVAGGRAAGWCTVWLDRGPAPGSAPRVPPLPIAPDLTVATLCDIMPWLVRRFDLR